jgi:Spy/CpxP family protein refolding chaperone
MRTFVATLAAIIILIPTLSIAQDCRLLQRADDLELTDQQVEQLQAAAMAQHKEMIQMRADLQKAKLEMKELMMAEKTDRAKVLKKSDEISALKAKMAKKRLGGRLDRLNLLTDDQRTKLRKDMMRPRPRHGKRDNRKRIHDGSGPGRIGGDDRPRYRMFDRFGDVSDNGGWIMAEDDPEIDDDLIDSDDF